MKWLDRFFEKYYPCDCRKQAAISSRALTIALHNFCDKALRLAQENKVTHINDCKKTKKENNYEKD